MRRIAYVNSPGGILENTHTTAPNGIAAFLLLLSLVLMLIYYSCVKVGVCEDDKPGRGKVEQDATEPLTPL